MKRTVFEYAATDKFLLLYLTADRPGGLMGLHTVHRDKFDPEIVEGMQGDDLGIPDIITCADVQVSLSDEGELINGIPLNGRNYSFVIKSMMLTWTQSSDYTERTIKHREDGPAQVEFRDFKGSHSNGARSGFGMGAWKFMWYINNRLRRDAGPYSVNGDKFDAVVDPQGSIRTLKKIDYMFGWNHPGGGNMTEEKIQAAITQNEIALNRLAPGASVFDNTMEQAFFYSTV